MIWDNKNNPASAPINKFQSIKCPSTRKNIIPLHIHPKEGEIKSTAIIFFFVFCSRMCGQYHDSSNNNNKSRRDGGGGDGESSGYENSRVDYLRYWSLIPLYHHHRGGRRRGQRTRFSSAVPPRPIRFFSFNRHLTIYLSFSGRMAQILGRHDDGTDSKVTPF